MAESIFSWASLGDLSVGRSNMGPKVDVEIYRLMQYTMHSVLVERFGDEQTRELFQSAGRVAGMAFTTQFLDCTLPVNAFIAQLNEQLIQHQIGILRVEKADLEKVHLVMTVSEDLDCSGLPVNGETVCDYDEGFIAGILEVYFGKPFSVKEIDCWATGDRTCRFDVHLKE